MKPVQFVSNRFVRKFDSDSGRYPILKNHLADNLIAQLNGIYHLSAMGNESRARNQIKILAETLRYKVRNRNELVSLRLEIEMVADLFSLFSVRWGDEFHTFLDVPEDLLDEYIPHYSIMDLVENSLFHAFETLEKEKRVRVSAVRDGGGVTILVEDNGCGFRAFDDVVKARRDTEIDSLGGLGSLRKRLSTLYGGEAHLEIHSSSGAGTKAELFIPDTKPSTGSI